MSFNAWFAKESKAVKDVEKLTSFVKSYIHRNRPDLSALKIETIEGAIEQLAQNERELLMIKMRGAWRTQKWTEKKNKVSYRRVFRLKSTANSSFDKLCKKFGFSPSDCFHECIELAKGKVETHEEIRAQVRKEFKDEINRLKDSKAKKSARLGSAFVPFTVKDDLKHAKAKIALLESEVERLKNQLSSQEVYRSDTSQSEVAESGGMAKPTSIGLDDADLTSDESGGYSLSFTSINVADNFARGEAKTIADDFNLSSVKGELKYR